MEESGNNHGMSRNALIGIGVIIVVALAVVALVLIQNTNTYGGSPFSANPNTTVVNGTGTQGTRIFHVVAAENFWGSLASQLCRSTLQRD